MYSMVVYLIVRRLVEEEHAHAGGKTDEEGEEEDGKVRTVHVFEGTHKNVHCRGGRHAEEKEGLIVKQLIEEAGKVLGKGGGGNKG